MSRESNQPENSLRREKLQNILDNFNSLQERLASPDTAQPQLLGQLLQERSRLLPLVQLVEDYLENDRQLSELRQSLQKESDPELRAIMAEELPALEQQVNRLAEKIEWALVPKDPDAGKNMLLEIRAGTGGEEAALFASDLFRMYCRYFDQKGVKYEVMSLAETGLKGLKEAIVLVKGELAYDLLHLEGGTHRVQRIPETESGGRIHTSACTVAVIPEVEESEFELDGNDLRIDVYRASGAGGQHVNKTESAVRITHIPSGIVVSCQDEKSQHKNKARALSILRARVAESQKAARHEQASAEKKAQVGSGDRSEKIRTYNFPQNRVTDHRINYTSHNLDQLMEGNMEDLIDALLEKEREMKLAQARPGHANQD